MTDRIHSIMVVLEKDIRDDEIQPLLDAIQLLRGVLKVKANVTDVDAELAQSRAYQKLRGEVMSLLFPAEEA